MDICTPELNTLKDEVCIFPLLIILDLLGGVKSDLGSRGDSEYSEVHGCMSDNVTVSAPRTRLASLRITMALETNRRATPLLVDVCH